jgi:hypothetical protein
MELKELLALEKRNFLIRANGGIAMPAAGFIYWLAAGVAGYYVKPQLWVVAVCFCSGLIFPLALALAKPLKSNVMAKSELSSLLFPALVSMLTFWPLAFAGGAGNPAFMPLAIGVGMGMHWPVIGWMYGGKSFFMHFVVRTIGCTAIWYMLPDHRFTVLPLFVAATYFVTLFAIKYEVNKAMEQVINEKLSLKNL